jgi:hypothetical protein
VSDDPEEDLRGSIHEVDVVCYRPTIDAMYVLHHFLFGAVAERVMVVAAITSSVRDRLEMRVADHALLCAPDEHLDVTAQALTSIERSHRETGLCVPRATASPRGSAARAMARRELCSIERVDGRAELVGINRPSVMRCLCMQWARAGRATPAAWLRAARGALGLAGPS